MDRYYNFVCLLHMMDINSDHMDHVVADALGLWGADGVLALDTMIAGMPRAFLAAVANLDPSDDDTVRAVCALSPDVASLHSMLLDVLGDGMPPCYADTAG